MAGWRSRGPGRLAFAGLVVAAAGALAVPAAADQGVAMSAGEITFTEPLEPGSRHEVPPIWVSNPGSDPADFAVQVKAVAVAPAQRLVVDDGDGPTAGASMAPTTIPRERGARAVPAGWLSISPTAFHLAPGGTQEITVVLDLPADAEPGRYHGLLSAGVGGHGAGTTIGAAAAARIDYTVASGRKTSAESGVAPAPGGVRQLRDHAFLLAVIGSAAAAVVAALRVKRRFVIHVERR